MSYESVVAVLATADATLERDALNALPETTVTWCRVGTGGSGGLSGRPRWSPGSRIDYLTGANVYSELISCARKTYPELPSMCHTIRPDESYSSTRSPFPYATSARPPGRSCVEPPSCATTAGSGP